MTNDDRLGRATSAVILLAMLAGVFFVIKLLVWLVVMIVWGPQ